METRILVHFNIIRSDTYCLFWLLCIVSITEVYCSQNVIQYENEGDTVILSCPLTPPSVSGRTTWRGPPSDLVYFLDNDKNPSIDREERLSVIHNTASGAYNLRITNLTIGVDDGMFSCEVNTNPTQLYYITLKFNIAVHIISLQPSSNPFTIKEGSTKEIICKVNQNAAPPPAITWYLNNSIIETNTISINIIGNRTDNGKTLECRASNSNKLPKTASTTLNVEYSPSVNPLSQQDIIEGRELSVTCQATPGNPNSTTFYWTKVDNSGFRQNGATLQLPKIQRTSSGTYRCITENTFINGEKGIHSQPMVVNVFYSPTLNALSQQNIIEGRDLSVTCQATPGNPNSTTFYWTKVDNPGFRQNGSTLQLCNIQRTSSGTYRCTAENNYSNGEKGRDRKTMSVNVQYSPIVYTLSQQDIIEGGDLSVTCQATDGNPSSTTFYWIKEDNSAFTQNGATLKLYKIQRTSSGTYKCTAENTYSDGEKGTNSQIMVINVLYPPTIENRPLQIVNESDKVTLTRDISSNPLSKVSWYSKTELLKTQTSVKRTSFFIVRATCTDTMNYTLVASNGVGNIVAAIVELIVNCKPVSDKTNITLGVTCTTGIEFSSTIIAYPEPLYELQYENGTRINHLMNSITRNAMNNFTIYLRQAIVEKSSFGRYYLSLSNFLGETTVIVNIIELRRPDYPRKVEVMCEETKARVQWISSFNGGDPQYFTVITLNSEDGTIFSNRLTDNGENEIHVTYITNLESSVTYWFSVSAKNSHGSSSSNVTSCKTIRVKETASSQTGAVAGSVVGALMFATFILIIVILAHRRYACIIAFEKRNRDIKVDTKKDASNYTTINEQQDHTQRDMYDELTPNENANQYEAITQKDNHGNNEKLYEQLQESVAKEGNSINQNIPLKTKDSSDDKFVTQYAEEYVNTSFIE